MEGIFYERWVCECILNHCGLVKNVGYMNVFSTTVVHVKNVGYLSVFSTTVFMETTLQRLQAVNRLDVPVCKYKLVRRDQQQ